MNAIQRAFAATLEAQVVLTAARPFLDATALTRLRHLASQAPDWAQVFVLALQSKVLPVCWLHLQQAHVDGIPASVRQCFTQEVGAQSRFALRRTGELVRLVRRFERAGIDVMPLKGPVLAKTLYGQPGLRQFSDLDLLVPFNAVGRAVTLLQSLGYVLDASQPAFDGHQAQAFARVGYGYHFDLRHPETQVKVELHWRIGYGEPVPAPAFWKRRASCRIAGHAVRTFKPEEQIRYLCLHGAKDQWLRLSWLVDVAAFMLRAEKVNWGDVWRDACRAGEARRLLLGLYLASQLFEVPLPAAMRSALRANERFVHRRAMESRVLDLGYTDHMSAVNLRYQWVLRERVQDRLRFLTAFVVRPRIWAVPSALPPERFWWLLLRRPFRLLGALTRRSWASGRWLASRAA